MFKRLFAPTSKSLMSNIFRDSESFGKSNEKKGSQNLKKSNEWCKFTAHFTIIFVLRI